MRNQSKKALTVAIVIAAFVGGIALMIASSKKLGEGLAGATKIAVASDGSLWVVSHRHLHQFSSYGEHRRKIPLEALDVDDVVSGLAAAGEDTVFIAQSSPSSLRRCNIASRRCTSLDAAIRQSAGPTRFAVMIAANDATRQLAISDNAGHRVLIADFDGHVSAQTKAGEFAFPNQPVWLDSDEIAVPDTNHYRITRLHVAAEGLTPSEGEIHTGTTTVSRPGHPYPMDAKRAPDGSWWVLNAANGMMHPDLLHLDKDGKALRRIDLGDGSNATALALAGSKLIVAEPDQAALLSVALEGEANVRNFGDGTFMTEMKELKSQRTLWKRMCIAAQLLCVLVPLAGVLVLKRLGEPVSVVPKTLDDYAVAAPEPVEGQMWMEVQPAYLRRLRIALVVHAAMCAAVTGMSLQLLGSATLKLVNQVFPFIWIAVAAMAGVIAFDLYALIRGLPSWRIRIGTDGNRILLDSGRKGAPLESFEFKDVVFSERSLLLGKRILPLGMPLGYFFDPARLQGLILSRLPRASRVSHFEFVRRAMRNGNRTMLASIILIAVSVVLLFIVIFFPGAWRLLRQLPLLLSSLAGMR